MGPIKSIKKFFGIGEQGSHPDAAAEAAAGGAASMQDPAAGSPKASGNDDSGQSHLDASASVLHSSWEKGFLWRQSHSGASGTPSVHSGTSETPQSLISTPGPPPGTPYSAARPDPLANDLSFQRLSRMLKMTFPIPSVTHSPTRICDWMYLGSMHNSILPKHKPHHLARFANHRFTHVINLAASEPTIRPPPGAYEERGIGYTEIYAEDTQGYNILQHFDDVAAILDHVWQTGGKVLIHCQAGVNRTGTLAIAYYVSRNIQQSIQWEAGEEPEEILCNLIDVADYIRKARGRICTNDAFQRQVYMWCRERKLPITAEEMGLNQASSTTMATTDVNADQQQQQPTQVVNAEHAAGLHHDVPPLR